MIDTRVVRIEREFAHPPDRVWRALTVPHLISEWLMANNFDPEMGHVFEFNAEWGAISCRVTEIEPGVKLSYTWEANGLESIVTWTITPTNDGTLLCMEQVGFKSDQNRAYIGASRGWPNFFDRLGDVLELREDQRI